MLFHSSMALSRIIFEIMRDICRKSRFFHTPRIRGPRKVGPCRNVAIRFGTEKLEWCGYLKVKKLAKNANIITRFNTIHERDRHKTNGQTPHNSIALCIASRGKN